MKWNFSRIDNIEESGFNKNLNDFFKKGIDGFIRENIQNSLDAAATEEPVIVKINIGKMDVTEIPGFEEIKEHIKSLKGYNEYTKENIEVMMNSINEKVIDYITIEDCNTTGLEYSTSTDDNAWNNYAYKKNVHMVKEGDLESSRGGSHGIGKIASNAASKLNMIYFASCDKYDNRIIGGNIMLVEHEMGDKKYRATGYFSALDNTNKFIPYDNNYSGIFAKNTKGLKVIIPFLHEELNDRNEIIRCVCDNFFVAILEKNLIVEFNEETINADTVIKYVEDKMIYPFTEISEIKKNFTPLYVDTYRKIERENNVIYRTLSDKEQNNYDIKIYFQYNSEYAKGRTAIIRSKGMKIEDWKVTGKARAHYNAILMPVGSKCEEFIKSLENESHTKISADGIVDKNKKSNARSFLKDIDDVLKTLIESYEDRILTKSENINTADVLYENTHVFKKSLEKTTSSISINERNGQKKQITVIKRPRITKPKNPTIPGNGGNGKGKYTTSNGNNKKMKSIRYTVDHNSVRRLVTADKEIIEISLFQNEKYNNERKCDLRLDVVDALGKNYMDELNLTREYETILDKNSKSAINIENNLIKDISVKDGKIRLEMTKKRNMIDTLTLQYLIEVKK